MTRRHFLRAGGVAAVMSPHICSLASAQTRRRAAYTFTQYHNQPETSTLHRHLVDMWTAIGRESGGRIEATVFAENNRIAGSDPAALKLLLGGEIQCFTLQGGILGNVVPSADVQQVPFAFKTAAAAHRAMDGALGAYLRRETAAKNLHFFQVGTFDNGMRQISTTKQPIAKVPDLAGMRMRIPDGRIYAETFRALGAEPVTINVNGLFEALRAGRVDAQENPLAIVELFKLYEVLKYVALTNHMWSGFNLLAHLPTWDKLPPDVRNLVTRNVVRAVHRQRREQASFNDDLRKRLASRGLRFNEIDPAPFRTRLSRVYGIWKERLGTRCWSLLEAEVGSLG